MKKITILLITLLITSTTFSQITYSDIPDFTFTHDSFVAVDIDFNNDGTAEFTFDEQGGGTVGTFFDPANINFWGTGDFDSGHGWDIIKALPNGNTIDNNGVFDAQADAYINAFWANTGEMFPEGDSYIGVWFKLGANKHYGWMRVNSVSGVITLLDYAYNTTPDEAINAGQQVLSINDISNAIEVNYYPNPTKGVITIRSKSSIDEAKLIDITGKTTLLKVTNYKVNISSFSSGIYFLHIRSNKNTAIKKIIKL